MNKKSIIIILILVAFGAFAFLNYRFFTNNRISEDIDLGNTLQGLDLSMEADDISFNSNESIDSVDESLSDAPELEDSTQDLFTHGGNLFNVKTNQVSGRTLVKYSPSTSNVVVVKLADPGDFSYEGWLVQQNPLEFFSTGVMTKTGENEYLLEYKSDEETPESYDFVVITLEENTEDNIPEAHVAEGTVSAIDFGTQSAE